MRLHSDERGFVNRSVLFLLIVFIVVGIVIIDGSSVLFTKWGMSDAADAAAIDAAVEYRTSQDLESAQGIAQATMDERGDGYKITHISVDTKTGAVTITAQTTASTLFIKHIGPLEDMTHLKIESTGTAPLG